MFVNWGGVCASRWLSTTQSLITVCMAACWSFDSIAFHSHVTGVSNFFLRTDDDLLAKPLMCQNNSNKLDIDMKTSYGII